MKRAKNLLALLLCMSLAAGFALPAFADEATSSGMNWEDFYITEEPQDVTVPYGDGFTLRVQVNVPAGAAVEYQWYTGSGWDTVMEETTPQLHIQGKSHRYYPKNTYLSAQTAMQYYCKITAYEKDSSGKVLSSKQLDSRQVEVTFLHNDFLHRYFVAPFDAMKDGAVDFLGSALIPLEFALTSTIIAVSASYGVALPIAPVLFLGALVAGCGIMIKLWIDGTE